MAETTITAHAPFRTIDGDRTRGLVIICDHASNAVPPELGDLGLPPQERARHIAWDIGAAAIAESLARRFEAPAVICGTSRLVIDCNRHPEDPTSIPEVGDGTAIPGNRHLTVWDRTQRIARWFIPYHDAIEAEIAAARTEPVLLSVHSMTDAMNGVTRPWPVAISWHRDERLSRPMIAALQRRIEQRPSRTRVTLAGHIDNPFPMLAGAGAFASTSLRESFGNVLVEALCLGVPVISTDCPHGPAEILDAGRYGLLVPVGDAAALADAVRRLADDAEMRQRLAEQGPARADFFSLERHCLNVIALFEPLLRRGTP